MNYEKIISKIVGAKTVLVFTHVNMDGDAMGSTIALCHVMKKLGKNCYIVKEDQIPHYLTFMDGVDFFVDADQISTLGLHLPDCLGFIADLGTLSRLENRKDIFLHCGDSCLIDHHMYGPEDLLASAECREPEASATCVLALELVEALEEALNRPLLDKNIANALYVGILTDTGAFKYSNTDARTHMAAAKLFSYNIDHAAICTAIYDNYPPQQLKLEIIIMNRMQLACNGKAAISWCTFADMDGVGAQPSMAETGVDRLRSGEGVEIAALIKEKGPGLYKVSLRAKSYANVNHIATAFGGGGHEKAAGFNSCDSLNTLLEKLIAAMEKELF